MSPEELIARLERARPRRVPAVDYLLERAFVESESQAPGRAWPVAAAAGLVLGVAGSGPAWIDPSRAERERTAAVTEFATEAFRNLRGALNPPETRD